MRYSNVFGFGRREEAIICFRGRGIKSNLFFIFNKQIFLKRAIELSRLANKDNPDWNEEKELSLFGNRLASLSNFHFN